MRERSRGLSAFLFGSWLLMMEPLDRPGAPIHEWDQFSAYDSAVHCENTRMGVLDQEQPHQKVFKRFKRMRCVPAEYIYQPKAEGE